MGRAPAWILAVVLAGPGGVGCVNLDGPTDGPATGPEPAERQIIVAVHDERAGPQARAGSLSRPYGRGTAYRGSLQSRQQMARLAKQHELRAVASWPIALLDLYCVVFEVPEGRSRDAMLASLAAEPGVVLAQPMQVFSTLAARPADGRGLVAGTEVRRAHQWATGRGVKVALIDTGMDSGHPALEGRILSELDFVGSQAFPPAEEPHGLAVAGVIAARAGSQPEIVGIAPDAGLLALRACWHTDPVRAVCSSLTLARAIAAAVEQDAAVINLSLTGPSDPLLERLLKRAIERNRVVVGALPDLDDEGGEVSSAVRFPTSVPGVIAVQTAEHSGRRVPGALPAPGQDVLTLRPGGGYELASGSSLAAAHVSGLVALLRERSSRLGAEQVRALLSEHVHPLALDGRTVEVVNACRAVAALVGGHCSPLVQRTAEAGLPVDPAPVSTPEE